jgi:hypothetical protein
MSSIKDGAFIKGDDLHSFLMIGQSNMAGRGEFSDVEPINNFRCYMLRNGRFLRMREPVNPDRAIFEGTFHSGVSLSASFADEFSKCFRTRIGLIPCADGGTTIDEWQPGEILYDHAVFMTRLAMRSSKFSGILWHQGESDSSSDESVLQYKPKLINLIRSLRRDLGAEELPFIMGELSEDISEEWKMGDRVKKMNSIFYEVAEETSKCGVASAKGLSLKPDGIHFNSVSLREFGKRYFDIYKKVR